MHSLGTLTKLNDWLVEQHKVLTEASKNIDTTSLYDQVHMAAGALAAVENVQHKISELMEAANAKSG